jgi:hypothetical protein
MEIVGRDRSEEIVVTQPMTMDVLGALQVDAQFF